MLALTVKELRKQLRKLDKNRIVLVNSEDGDELVPLLHAVKHDGIEVKGQKINAISLRGSLFRKE